MQMTVQNYWTNTGCSILKIIMRSILASISLRLLVLGYFIFSCEPVESQNYAVSKASFSLDRYNDYSPVYFRRGLVFCSTRQADTQAGRASTDQMEDANIWYVPMKENSVAEADPILLEGLYTAFNDGPATFSPDGLEIYYSRNLDVDSRTRDIFDSRNQLGLFSARWTDSTWSDITPFPYNSIKYSLTTPALSADGKRIYFASNMRGGYGGADLWHCDWSEDGWLPPVNLGPKINTKGNESYPFENGAGILYFASDGLKGFGKKDIFFTMELDGEWADPVHLGGQINSNEDDFGLITDLNGKKGYFSSNRENADDIYHFVTLFPQFYACDSLQKNFYCYEFFDESRMQIDSLPLSYMWYFSDGGNASGLEVEHCFPGAGHYLVELHIIDNNTGNTFFTQSSFEVEIADVEQPFIASPDAIVIEEVIAFNANKTNLPGLDVEEYFWDFGDGARLRGAEVEHSYSRKGSYRVQLMVSGKPDSTGWEQRQCVYKVVEVLQDHQEMAMHKAVEEGSMVIVMDSTGKETYVSQSFYSLEEAQEEDAVFRVEVLNSDTRISTDSAVFDPLRGVYDIKEVFLREDSIYSYTVGQSEDVLGTYDVYADVVARGFENASVKSYILADLAEEELLQLTDALGNFSDAYFEFDDYRIGEASYPILDEVVNIMNRYPKLRLEIAAHTDNMGSFEYNMTLSQKRAQSMVDYLVNQGIEAERLIGKGYGESRPIASNTTEEGKMLNRRVEFIILDERKKNGE
jgi:outer membrane protein OmpA-like peptidoglycan-associated protein